MNQGEEFAELLRMDPRNQTWIDMMFEWYYCDADLSWAEAEAEVERVRVPALRAKELVEATHLISGKGRLAVALRFHALHAAHCPVAECVTVTLVEGNAEPLDVSNFESLHDPYWGQFCVTVGARWIKATAERIRSGDPTLRPPAHRPGS